MGIPSGGLPKVKDDKVIFQASHPSLWSGEVIAQMKEILQRGELKILPRPPGKLVHARSLSSSVLLGSLLPRAYRSLRGGRRKWQVIRHHSRVFSRLVGDEYERPYL